MDDPYHGTIKKFVGPKRKFHEAKFNFKDCLSKNFKSNYHRWKYNKNINKYVYMISDKAVSKMREENIYF